MTEIENAKIDRTAITVEDHGIFTVGVMLSGPGWAQSIPARCFGSGRAITINQDGKIDFNETTATAETAIAFRRFLCGIMAAVGAESWEDVAGKVCKIKRENGLIVAVGHIIENRWFHP